MQRVVVEEVADIRNDVRVMQRFENLRIVGQKQTANLFEKKRVEGAAPPARAAPASFAAPSNLQIVTIFQWGKP